MVLSEREKHIASAAAITAVGIGAVYLLLNRKKIVRRFCDPLYGQKVEIVTNDERCRHVVNTLRRHCSEMQVLGFDCEWVSEQGKRRPVAMLQLASHRGLCALFRLCDLKQIPKELDEILNDPKILKVGVGPFEDAKLLRDDYNVKVESTLDLRFLAEKCEHPGPHGMARLAEAILAVKLDKSWRVRASNWEQRELSERQILYAANDAHVAVELFRVLSKRFVPCGFFTDRKKWMATVLEETECFLDQKFTENRKNKSTNGCKQKKKKLLGSKDPLVSNKRTMATRAKPLYDNCFMQAPDGEVLCTCDRRKAEWYVAKELAEIVSHHPSYTIRLKFEPKGRAVGEVGEYYQTPKENRCVVCGAKDSYIRKNVVPRDYRKHFPTIMKEHISHDVLLLCVNCHRRSNIIDEDLRLKLSAMCMAPYSARENPKDIHDGTFAEIRKAARALVFNASKIPPERKQAIERKLIKLLHKNTSLSQEELKHYANIKVVIPNDDYCAHGKAVVEHFKTEPALGLSELEAMWRRHFLQTMKPKFLPKLWSVEHNYKRLEIRAEEGRVDEADLIVAGVFTKRTARNGSSSGASTNTTTPSSSANLSNRRYDFEQRNGNVSKEAVESDNDDDDDTTTRDVSSYCEEEDEIGVEAETRDSTRSSNDLDTTAFYSNRNNDQHQDELDDDDVTAVGGTWYGSVTAGCSRTTNGSEQASMDQFKTLVADETDQCYGESAATDSEQATVDDFASSFDSDDSDSTLSQPSMTLLNSTDDWEAEANEPSVNGSISLGKR